MRRTVELAHRLTGWNALASRAKELKLNISDAVIKVITTAVKNQSDEKSLDVQQLDNLLVRAAQLPILKIDVTLGLDEKWEGENPSSEVARAANTARTALFELQSAAIGDIIQSIPVFHANDTRRSRVALVTGHLFDTAVINKLMDFCVDCSCDFKVLSLDIPNDNDLATSMRVQLWGDSVAALDDAVNGFEEVLRGDDCSTAWEDTNTQQ